MFQLQEAFARGDLKPGLNIELDGTKRKAVNNIVSVVRLQNEIKNYGKFSHFIYLQ